MSLLDTICERRDSGLFAPGKTGIVGFGVAQLFGPDGELKQEVEFTNLVTDVGDLYYAQRCASGTPTAPTGMRLGTGNTAVAKNGAGAAIVTYANASNVALTGGTPTAAAKAAGTGARITWQATWGAGVATGNGLAEVVLTNESPLTNVAGTAANTIARALLAPVVNKGANDSLVVNWFHDVLGA
jgi:hypothetical protein